MLRAIAQFLHPEVERRTVQSQPRRGSFSSGESPIRFLQDREYVITFYVCERLGAEASPRGCGHDSGILI